jgi:hypothetical protein
MKTETELKAVLKEMAANDPAALFSALASFVMTDTPVNDAANRNKAIDAATVAGRYLYDVASAFDR